MLQTPSRVLPANQNRTRGRQSLLSSDLRWTPKTGQLRSGLARKIPTERKRSRTLGRQRKRHSPPFKARVALEEFKWGTTVVKATSAAIEHQFTPPTDGFVRLMGRLTAFVSETTMALVEDGVLPGSRQLDMGNSVVVNIYQVNYDKIDNVGSTQPTLAPHPCLQAEEACP